MTYSIHITETAERDISEAADYIEFVIKNPAAADQLLDKAENVINSLAEYPHRIKTVGDSFLSALGIHAVPISNYIIFFIIDEKEKRVNILRFMYKKRDWAAILKLDINSNA